MDYLKPLRRKFGVVTLLLLSVFFVAWIRSHFAKDEYEHRINRLESWTIYNAPNGIHFVTTKTDVLPDGQVALGGTSVKLPYLFVLMPLMFLSGWLLLSKPRLGKAPTGSPPGTEL